MARRPTSGLLAVDFFTSGYRISGHVSTRAKSVADMLNERLTSYLALENVYISRISSPGDIIATGTPAGIAPVMPGDMVTCRLSGIGELRNPVAAAPAT